MPKIKNKEVLKMKMKTNQSKVNFFEGILQVIALLTLWFGKIANYTISGGTVFDTTLGIQVSHDTVSSSIYFKDFFDTMGLFAAIIIILCLCNTVMCFFSAFSKKQTKDGIIHTLVPIITFALSIFVYGQGVLNITASTRQSICNYTPVKTIVLGLLFIVIILAFFKRSKFIVSNCENTQTDSSNTSHADELKKFKDLLDSGVITQEEFDQKKKQLLGL